MTRIIIIVFFILITGCKKSLPEINTNYEGASAVTIGQEIIISTGVVEGKWEWTGKGFVTTGFRNLASGTEWVSKESATMADWDLGMPGMEKARLIALDATESDDENTGYGLIREHPD